MNNYNITSYKDLQQEERCVKLRLKEQEETLRLQFKKLPEEIVVTGVTKVITSFTSGNIINSGGRILRSVVSHFLKNNSGENIFQNGIKTFITNLVDKFINKTDKE
ncbi:MAG: hypothetical protein K0S44_2617 [Bacteroidetes bacterium]|jgi:hypothetical protein|nr:hypothetical protein [Bacteroidota bacterium]